MMENALTDKDRAELLAEMQPVVVTPDPEPETLTLPAGRIVPWVWVVEQFDRLKGRDGDGRSKAERSIHNKKIYKELQDARTHHNAAVKRSMKEDKLQVVSGEVARRVREANARAAEPIELDEDVLNEVSSKVLQALLKAR